jgi:Zn-dependent protease
MFGTRWRLFRLLGIRVSMDASWVVILVLLTVSLGSEFPGLVDTYYPGVGGQLAPWAYWVVAPLTAVAFFSCLLPHEVGHAVAARSQGIRPRGVTLFLFGGVAELGEEPPTARAELIMALAGPVVSLVLATLFGLFAWLGYQQGWAPLAVIALGQLAAINTLVLAFNLVPAFPLDGGRVLRSVLWRWTGSLRRATYWAAFVGRAFAGILILWGVLNVLSGNWLGGVWIGLIGLFLSNAAQASYQQVLVHDALEGEPVRRFMNPDPITVSPSLDLRRWVDDFVYRYHRKTVPGGLRGPPARLDRDAGPVPGAARGMGPAYRRRTHAHRPERDRHLSPGGRDRGAEQDPAKRLRPPPRDGG